MDIPLKEDKHYKQKHVIYIWYTWLKKRCPLKSINHER